MKVSIGKWKTHTHTCPLPHTKAHLCQGASEADTHWGPASPSPSRKAAFLVFHKGERLWQRREQAFSKTADLIHPQTDTMWRGKLQETGRLCPRKDFLQAVNRKLTWKAVLKIHRRLETSSKGLTFQEAAQEVTRLPCTLLSRGQLNMAYSPRRSWLGAPECGLNFTWGFINPWSVLGYLWESLQPREKIKSLSSHTHTSTHMKRGMSQQSSARATWMWALNQWASPLKQLRLQSTENGHRRDSERQNIYLHSEVCVQGN